MELQDSSNIHDILTKITDYDNLLDVHLLTSVLETHHNKKREHIITLQGILNNTELLEKKILNIENEINKIKISHNKNNEKYKIVNGERLKFAKKFVDLENEFSKIKCELDDLDLLFRKYNDELVLLNRPSYNQLYLELIKGFGIEFINDRKYICRIRSNRKKCLIEIELDNKKNEPLYKLCNEIWNNM